MKKRILAYFFIMCFFCLSILKVVFGQSLARQVFDNEDYEELFKRPEIIKVLPDALRTFREVGMNLSFRNNFLANPRFLFGINDDIDDDFPADDFTDEFISLLTVDNALRSLFWDEQFYEVLTNRDEINELITLIERIKLPPAMLVIKDGDNQPGNPNTILPKPLKIEVQDINENSLANIEVIFTVTKGNGTLSVEKVSTNGNGQAEVILTLGPNEGITQVEARVKDTDITQTFTAAAIQAGTTVPIVYITPPTDKSIFNVGDEFTLNLNFVNVEGVTSFKATVQFDSSTLGFFDRPDVNEVVIEGKISKDGVPDNAQLKFKVKTIDSSTITLSEVILYDDGNNPLPAPSVLNRDVVSTPTRTDTSEDINGDGIVNISDLILIANVFGVEGKDNEGNYHPEDVNKDEDVNILDLVLVASMFGAKCPVLLFVH